MILPSYRLTLTHITPDINKIEKNNSDGKKIRLEKTASLT